MARMLTRCPICESALGVSELACPRCQTRIAGRFDTCRFCRLAAEHLAFLEVFLRSEGNLSRVEKELGVSYPTVRNRLTAALTALGFTGEEGEGESRPSPEVSPWPPEPAPPPPPETAERRRQILDALARGEVGADEAARVLRELS